jgi:hypothetical protein
MRQADINRVKRAVEHIKAARTLIDNIKYLNREGNEERILDDVWGDLRYQETRLDIMTR